MLIPAIISITLALILYSIGVWWEHKDRILRKKHVAFFIAGLVCDTTGTALMSVMAKGSEKTGAMASAHGITGAVAIILMLLHAIWAVVVIKRNRPEELKTFHKFSVLVWAIWLIPYILGMIMGMR